MADRPRRTAPATLIVGAALLSLLLLVAIVAPIVLSDAATRLTHDTQLPPSSEHWFGTDAFGRDVFARALVATRLTLVMSIGATAIAVIVGIAIGVGAWVSPRVVRESILRIIEAAVAFPALIFALVIAAILGQGSVTAVFAIGIAGIPAFARITANLAASIAHRDYVSTARLLGVSNAQLILRHLLPSARGPLLVLATSSFALSLLEISSLSFVGLGVQNPQYDWGKLLSEGLMQIYTSPAQVMAPSIMLILAGVAAMLIGDGLSALYEPRRATAAGKKPSTRPRTAPAEHLSDDDLLLDVDGLSVIAPNGRVLVDGIAFGLRPGEIVGLVGESGSGKSTTAMAVAGLLAPGLDRDAARLRLGGIDLLRHRIDRRALATSIGVVYQDPGTTFNPALRMGAQLTELLRVHFGLSRRDAGKRMVDALDRVHVTDPEKRMGQHPFELSGGMLQRAMIASAVAVRPRLLIADEPTTALDVTVQAEVLRLLLEMNEQEGTAILLISHDLGVVRAVCERVLVMRSGVIVEELTGEALREGRVQHPYTAELLSATLDAHPAAPPVADAEEAPHA